MLAVDHRLELQSVVLLESPRRMKPQPAQSVAILGDALHDADLGPKMAEAFRIDGRIVRLFGMFECALSAVKVKLSRSP